VRFTPLSDNRGFLLVQTQEYYKGLKLDYSEEILVNQGWLNVHDLNKTGSHLIKISYKQYLL
jgi:hypothetical protein